MRRFVLCGLLAAPLMFGEAAGQDSRHGAGSSGGGSQHSGSQHGSWHGGSGNGGGWHSDSSHGGWRRGHGDHRSQFWFNVGFPVFWGGGFTPVFPPYYPPIGYFGYTVVNPVTIVNVVPPLSQPAAPAPAAPAPAAQNNPPDPAKQKVTNAEHKARAGRFLGFGDAQFAKQRYLAAVERYKTAVEIAPDVAESYFRQAVAHVALAQYESAARMFRRGLQVRADWATPPFRLDQLYDGAPLAKTHHLEDLARAVEANPFDADLLMVLGLELFFDGQPERARVFFDRSVQLGGNEDRLLDTIIGQPPAPGAQPNAPQAKISF